MARVVEIAVRVCLRLASGPLLVLLSILLLLVSPAASQQEPKGNLPDPTDYRAAGPTCQTTVKVSPWVGTPAVDWPSTYHCVLDIHTCEGVKTYKSDVRPGGTGMCDDYWKVHHALADREICCDSGTSTEERSTEAVPTPRPSPTAPPAGSKYTRCDEAMNDRIAQAVNLAIDALEFSGCMERNGQSFEAWRDRLRNMRFVCWDAITNQDEPPCAMAGRPRETIENFSRDHITIFSRNIASCGCLHANLIHELAHTFDYGHAAPRNAYELELDCAACGK